MIIKYPQQSKKLKKKKYLQIMKIIIDQELLLKPRGPAGHFEMFEVIEILWSIVRTNQTDFCTLNDRIATKKKETKRLTYLFFFYSLKLKAYKNCYQLVLFYELLFFCLANKTHIFCFNNIICFLLILITKKKRIKTKQNDF